MAMTSQFKEVVGLLLKGTTNGRLAWRAVDAYGTYVTRIGENLFTVGVAETGTPRVMRLEDDQPELAPAIRLRILHNDGDELESVTLANKPGGDADFTQLLGLWQSARRRRYELQDERLRGVADVLRATVSQG